MEVIDPVPLKLDAVELARDMHTERFREELVTLFGRALPLIEPKVVFTTTHVRGFENDLVNLENGHVLKGIVLADLLDSGQELIPYVATIGPKLENEISREKNMLQSFLLDKIGNYAVRKAGAHLKSLAAEKFGTGLGSVSEFSPGEPGDGELFGIEEQKPLFQILDPAAASVGVHLSPSLMMVPKKSRSGVLAATRQKYNACAYCPQVRCEGRRMRFLAEYQRIKHM